MIWVLVWKLLVWTSLCIAASWCRSIAVWGSINLGFDARTHLTARFWQMRSCGICFWRYSNISVFYLLPLAAVWAAADKLTVVLWGQNVVISTQRGVPEETQISGSKMLNKMRRGAGSAPKSQLSPWRTTDHLDRECFNGYTFICDDPRAFKNRFRDHLSFIIIIVITTNSPHRFHSAVAVVGRGGRHLCEGPGKKIRGETERDKRNLLKLRIVQRQMCS